MSIKSDLLSLVERYRNEIDVKTFVADMSHLVRTIECIIYEAELDRVKSSPSYLGEQLRNEIETFMTEDSIEANGNDAYVDDYAIMSDDDLVAEYESLVDGDEEDEILAKALLAKAEYDMLTKEV